MKKYTLKHPIKDADGNEIKELTFIDQLRAKHLVRVPGRFLELVVDAAAHSESESKDVDIKASIFKSVPELIQYLPQLVSIMTDMPEDTIGELALPDLFGCFEVMSDGFFGGSGLPEETGPQAS